MTGVMCKSQQMNKWKEGGLGAGAMMTLDWIGYSRGKSYEAPLVKLPHTSVSTLTG